MITEDRTAFFTLHQVEPCRHCLKRDEPGAGMGPIIASLLLDVHAQAEIDRLERKQSMDGQSDDWDKVLAERNRATYVRACWLANINPEQADILTATSPEKLVA